MSRRRPATSVVTATAAAAAVLVTAATAVVIPTAAHGATRSITTNEVSVVPANGVLQLQGHGFGHGHGLSQWGAQGAAESGVGLAGILDHYYPGTTTTVTAKRSLRVLLTGVSGTGVPLWASPGLTVTPAGGAAVTPPSDSAHARLRLVPTAGAVTLQSSPDGRTWTTEAAQLTAPVSVADSASVVRTGQSDGSSRDYRGSLTVSVVSSALRTVDVVDLESYLRGVVPRESPPGWLPAALQTQAVAARTYATYEAQHASSTAAYDICDTTACQVYGGARTYPAAGGSGTPQEVASTDAAVSATAGEVRTAGGSAAFTQFSASDGGWSSDGGQPYLPATADPWDGVDAGNTSHSWSATLTAAQLQKSFPSVGRLVSIEVTRRDGNGDFGGRVQQVVLHGSSSSGQATAVTTTGDGIAAAHPWSGNDGLRSSWWQIVGSPSSTPAAASAPQSDPGAAGALGVAASAPHRIVDTARLDSAAARRVTVAGRAGIPRGATSVLVVAAASRLAGASVADLQAWAGGAARSGAVRFTSLSSTTTAAGSAFVPLGADGSLWVAPSHGRVGLRLTVVGWAAPSARGTLTVPAHPVAAGTAHSAVQLVHAPSGAVAALVAVTARGTRGTLSIGGVPALTLRPTAQTITTLLPVSGGSRSLTGDRSARVGATVLAWVLGPASPAALVPAAGRGSAIVGSRGGLVTLPGSAAPSAARAVLALVSTRAAGIGTLGLIAHATSGPGPVIAASTGTSTTLVALPLRDRRITVHPSRGGATVTVTSQGWVAG